MTDTEPTEPRTTNREAAANPVPAEAGKDVGSQHPAHQADLAHMAADF